MSSNSLPVCLDWAVSTFSQIAVSDDLCTVKVTDEFYHWPRYVQNYQCKKVDSEQRTVAYETLI